MTEQIKKILEEEIAASQQYTTENFGARNGREFPELAEAVLENKTISTKLTVSFLINLLELTTSKNQTLERFSTPSKTARDESVNGVPLDFFWLGYRLGRRMQIAEDEALKNIEKVSV